MVPLAVDYSSSVQGLILEGESSAYSSTPTNEDGQTKLHELCQTPQVSVENVREFLDMYPDAVRVNDVYGRSPLFYALKRACSFEVVELLFSAYPEGVTQQDFCGESGIHLVYHSSKDVRLLEMMLRRDPSIALYRANSFSDKRLIERLCDSWSGVDITESPASLVNNDAWTKLILTIHAAHRATFSRQGDRLLNKDEELHAALELGLPPSVIQQLALVYPHQVPKIMTRCRGMLPLHYLLTQRRFASSKGVGSLIRCLIGIFPGAAGITFDGYYPLHMALTNGFKWHEGVREMVFACHDALHTDDTFSKLCPVMLAASRDGGDLDTIFSLLRERPTIQRAC